MVFGFMPDSPDLTLTYLFSTTFKFASRFVAESYQLPANNYFIVSTSCPTSFVFF